MAGTGIEQSRGGGAKAATLVEFVEGLGLNFFLLFGNEESHGDAHPEELRCLDTAGVLEPFRLIDNQVAVVQGLHAKVVEL